MSDTFLRRLGRTVGHLFLALLNATLLLVAVALVLSWMVLGRVENIADTTITAATDLRESITPISDRATKISDQLAGLRSDIVQLQQNASTSTTINSERILSRLDEIEDSLSVLTTSVAPIVGNLTAEPEALVERAVQTGVAEVGSWVATLTECRMIDQDA